ncbi:MAG: hypothetical protein DMF69_20710 [Acidobacteria bacterium]|nr:MAG: hypothetical protein DMF69_20710 [Acidobacteriota bacterium]
MVYGCPGISGNIGKAFFFDFNTNSLIDLFTPGISSGANFGTTVAITNDDIVVGAPNSSFGSLPQAGRAVVFTDLHDGTAPFITTLNSVSPGSNLQFGSSVAIDGDTLVVAVIRPLQSMGYLEVFARHPTHGWEWEQNITNSEVSHTFAQSVALSKNFMVVGSPGDDERGVDAGAAYVFERGANGLWTQKQKIMASDARTLDRFSTYAVKTTRS